MTADVFSLAFRGAEGDRRLIVGGIPGGTEADGPAEGADVAAALAWAAAPAPRAAAFAFANAGTWDGSAHANEYTKIVADVRSNVRINDS
jgi:hypothetical protein